MCAYKFHIFKGLYLYIFIQIIQKMFEFGRLQMQEMEKGRLFRKGYMNTENNRDQRK